jgi:hypothetical protein
MINYSFTKSVFDILLISSFKCLFLFILITELELKCIKIAYEKAKQQTLDSNLNNQEQQQQSLDASSILNLNYNDTETLIRLTSKSDNNNNETGLDEARTTALDLAQRVEQSSTSLIDTNEIKNLKHYRIFYSYLFVFINFVCLIYLSVKFGICMKQTNFLKNDFSFHLKNDSMMTSNQNLFFFLILSIEFAFIFIEFFVSLFNFLCFNRFIKSCFIKFILMINNNNNQQQQQDSENKKSSQNKNLTRLIGLSYPERWYILFAFLMLLISSITNIAVPYFFGLVVDAAQKFSDLTEMNKYILYMFGIFLFGSLASGIRSWLFELAGQRVVARLRNGVFNAIIRQDIKFFDENRTGELTSRLSSDTQVLQNAVTLNVSMLARYTIQILGSIIFMFTLEAKLTGLLLGVVPIVSLMTVHYGRLLRKMRKEFQDELAKSNIIAEETISSMRTVRSFAAEDKLSNDYNKNIHKSFLIGKKLAIAQGGFMAFVGLLSAGSLALILWYGGKLVHDKKITTGLLASFLMYTLQVAAAFAFITSLYGDFMQVLEFFLWFFTSAPSLKTRCRGYRFGRYERASK